MPLCAVAIGLEPDAFPLNDPGLEHDYPPAVLVHFARDADVDAVRWDRGVGMWQRLLLLPLHAGAGRRRRRAPAPRCIVGGRESWQALPCPQHRNPRLPGPSLPA